MVEHSPQIIASEEKATADTVSKHRHSGFSVVAVTSSLCCCCDIIISAFV